MTDTNTLGSKSVSNGHSNGDHVNGNSKNAKKMERPAPSDQNKAKRNSVVGAFKQIRQASRRPLPTELGDGRYRTVAVRPTLMQDLKSFNREDVRTLLDIIKAKVKGETQQDDKTMLMERTIRIVAGLPDHSRLQETLTNSFIDKLWNSLDHPPLLYVGPESKYRRPDGAFNNPESPYLGARGHTYARSCKPKHTQLGAQPDPESIFEAVMAREGFKKNPNNVSSILWYWATIIIHDLFWTNMKDQNKNDTSSYLDLAPLYGNTQESQDAVRSHKDGKLKPDAFADKRLIANPPGVCIILVMFNRFHNHVATNLAEINEGGRFTKPPGSPDDESKAAAWKKYDEELFQTARLVTSGLYINITLVDYVRNIINLNRVDTKWTLDPRQEMGVAVGTKEGSESGVGNVVSAEFNLCYRWHSCISEMDDKWIQDFYVQLLGENYGNMDLRALGRAIRSFEESVPEDPGQRVFGGFERGPDGRFNDDELIDALATAIEQPGGAFGARNVPRIMKPVEMMGIMRGRKWNLAGLNEFRKHFGLKAYETFEDINSDPEVAENLRNLYQHPDNVELYPGIVAEEAKSPMAPGVGIAPTYTISRVVLSDAVSLVRGDRYYTTDYHAGNLTNWGLKEVEYDLNVNHGCVFYKLFIRAFPKHFEQNSVYAHYPMVIPSENRKILTDLGRVHRFSFERPGLKSSTINLGSYNAAKHILEQKDKYTVGWDEGLNSLMNDGTSGNLLTGRTPHSEDQEKSINELFHRTGWTDNVKAFYSMISERLITDKSYKIAGKTQIDIVRDFGNLSHTHFASRIFNLPLKTHDNPKGVFSEQELYQALSLIFVGVSLDTDPAKSFPLRQAAKDVAEKLSSVIEFNVKLSSKLGLRGLYTAKHKDDMLSAYGVNLIKGLSKAGLSVQDITWGQILPIAGSMVPTQGQVFAQALDWYLSPAGEPYRDHIYELAAQPSSDETDNLLLGYALEGLRMSGTFSVHRRATTDDVIIEDDDRSVHIRAGDQVFVSLASAATDATHFPEPSRVNPHRPLDSYIHLGPGYHASVGRDMGDIALTELFRTVFRKKGLRRVQGAQGMLKKVPSSTGDGSSVYLTEDWGSTWPFPTTMKVTWDGE